MTTLLDSARKMVRRDSPDVTARLAGLEQAVAASRDRLDDTVVDAAERAVLRGTERLRLSAHHTVVGLAGATGSGKSSTFNAVAGLDLAGTGVRRPTTSWTMSCTWGHEGAEDLLEWLGVPRRHQIPRTSMLDQVDEDRDLQGLVLLDLPDHDSTEVHHHLEVDRLVQLVDVLVWVLDPQKYADAAIHDRYLKPLASHKDVMMVVLNHMDLVAEARRDGLVADLARLLEADGLHGIPVLPLSAKTGEGVPELKRAIAERVESKKATLQRVEADVAAAAAVLAEETGTARPADVARRSRTELVNAFSDAAGVPTVVRAVKKATTVRARRATGWPITSWLGRLRPDPLKRLHLDLDRRGTELTAAARASVPEATHVQRARVDMAVRQVAEEAAEGLAEPWAASIRRASVRRLPDLNDALDRAVSETDLGVSRRPVWWGIVRVVQWVLLLAALVGGLWLAGLFALQYLRMPEPPAPEVRQLPLPTVMLLGGIGLGIVLSLLTRPLVALGASVKGRRAEKRLRDAIAEVTDRLVIAPIESEVAVYREARDGIAVAQSS